MFALGVELLMRRAVISRWDNREEAEWPPHPDRVFMALVAGWGECGEADDQRAALEWLERLGPPSLLVPTDYSRRTPFTTYVPVNDKSDPRSAPLGTMPVGRNRQPRQYPAVVPAEPELYLIWPDDDAPDNLRPALDRLCEQTTYLGHSSTPVRMWVETAEKTPNLRPTEGPASYLLRVFGPGRAAALKVRFDAGLRPLPSHWMGYESTAMTTKADVGDGPFDPGLIVFRQVDGRRWSLESCGMIAKALRDTLMERWTRRYGTVAPEWLSGHETRERPSQKSRPAVVPLAFVGREHADGHLLGTALAIPVTFPADELQSLFDLFGAHDGEPQLDVEAGAPFVRLYVKHPQFDDRIVGECAMVLDESAESGPFHNLKPSTWTQPSKLWATASPVVLPKFPRRGLSPETVIAEACVQAGYPMPANVRVNYAAALAGSPHTRSFHTKPRDGRPPRPMTHAVILFEEPVRGPVLLGAGRYNGYGVCRPLPYEEDVP